MFSLEKALGKEDRFFDLLEASAEEARASVLALKRFNQASATAQSLDEVIQIRRKDKAITLQISEALCTTFVAALESEDIEALSNALYKIPKTSEKIAERIQLAPNFLEGVDLTRQMAMLEQAAGLVVNMIKQLRKGMRVELIKTLNSDLQQVEGAMDKLGLELLRDLYRSQTDPIRFIFLKDLYELVEKVTDRFRDAGTVITHIVLKNS